jgi:uncharacterized membrane protein
MQEKRNLKIIAILSIIGIIISSYLLFIKVTGYESFCDFSKEISCDNVSSSPYSEFPANSGIPIAGLGIIAYLLLLAPALLLLKGFDFTKLKLSRTLVLKLMFLWGLFSILFYIYLTYIELFVIYTICPLCVLVFAVSIIIFLFLSLNVKK